MAKQVIRQSSFGGGIISDDAQGRADLSKYLLGVRRLENMLPLVHGSVINRPGTEHIGYARPALAPVAVEPWDPLYPSDPLQIYSSPFLLSFEFSEEDTYLLTIDRMCIRPFRNGGAILESTPITINSITNAPAGHPTRTLVNVAGASVPWKHGDMIWIENCEGNTEPNDRFWYVRRFEGLGAPIATVTDNGGTARVVTTDNNHFANGESVYIDGVSGEMGVAVNDQMWTISFVDVYTFDLVGSSVAGKAQGTGGGCDCVARANWAVGGGIAADEFYLLDQRMEDVDSSGWSSYTADTGQATRRFELRGNRPLDKADCLYEEEDLFNIHHSQSADKMILVERGYAPRELARIAHSNWTIGVITFLPQIGTPSVSCIAGIGSEVNWYVTAIDAETGEESLAGTVQSLDPAPAGGGGSAVTIRWNAVTGAKYYYVYRDDQTYRRAGFVGLRDNDGAGPFDFSTAADADAIEPDFTIGPPKESAPFGIDGSGDCPGVVCPHEQRLFIGSTLNSPRQLWASVVGTFYNLNESVPIFADDALNFIVSSQKENRINNVTSLGALIVQTSEREFKITGSGGNLITAEAGGLSVTPDTHIGSNSLQALAIEDGALFVSDTGPEVRSLAYQFEFDGYRGSDLSVLVPGLMNGYLIVDWCYCKSPYRAVFLVRSDGTLLCLTYHKEHNVWGWSTHTTENGKFCSVASVREGQEHYLYCSVERTLNGVLTRHIERIHTREFRNYPDMDADARNCFFVDDGLSYDEPDPPYPGYDEQQYFVYLPGGYFRLPTTANYTADSDWAGGPNWDGDWVDLDGFKGGGGLEEFLNGKRFYVAEKNDFLKIVKLAWFEDFENYGEITAATMTGWTPTRFGTFRIAVTQVTGAHHLEGEEVSILADGHVAARQTVTDGVVVLGGDVERASRIHLGIPLESTFETLDAESSDPARSIAYYPQDLRGCALLLRDSRGMKWGPDEDHLVEHPQRAILQWGSPLPLLDGIIKTQNLPLTGEADHSRVVIRQDNPLPLQVLAIIRDIDVKLPSE